MDLLTLKRVTADEFTEGIGLVCGGALVRAHFVENDVCAGFGCLMRGFAASKASPDNVNYWQTSSVEADSWATNKNGLAHRSFHVRVRVTEFITALQ